MVQVFTTTRVNTALKHKRTIIDAALIAEVIRKCQYMYTSVIYLMIH